MSDMSAGQIIGGVIGGIIGFFVGAPIQGAMIGAAIGGALDPQKIDGPHLQDRKVQISSYGAAIPIIWRRSLYWRPNAWTAT